MNKVVTGSLWASSLMLAGTLAGCGSGASPGDSTTVTVAGDVPIAYAQRSNTMRINPTNGGLVAMLLLSDQVWVSPGQWGTVAVFAFLMASHGALVVNRA